MGMLLVLLYSTDKQKLQINKANPDSKGPFLLISEYTGSAGHLGSLLYLMLLHTYNQIKILQEMKVGLGL